MLPVVGLSLDLIGAIALTTGLFRGPMPLTLGWGRLPEDAAADRAYGGVGGLFLALGFLVQALGSFGVHPAASATANALWALVTICVGTLAAWALYGGTYMWQVKRLEAQARAAWPEIEPGRLQRTPRGLIFWHHERVRDPKPDSGQPGS